MSLPQITDVKGIGQSTAEILFEHDVNTVKDLARINIDLLMAIPGFSGIRAARVISEAQALLSAAETDNPAQPGEVESTEQQGAVTAKPMVVKEAAKKAKKDKQSKQAKPAKDKKKKKGKLGQRKKAEKGEKSKAKGKKR